MSADTVAGGSRTVALAHGKTGVYASVNGDNPRPFPLKGELNATSLAEALKMFDESVTTVLLIGTRADGKPGWDEVDKDELALATPHEVLIFSEAQALALDPDIKEPAAWLIMAPPTIGGLVHGSVRWWVQDENGNVNRADVQFLGMNYGQICGQAGAGTPSLMAGMVEAIISKHPHICRVYLWSADGQSGSDAYHRGDGTQPEGSFWRTLKLPASYAAAVGDVVILPTPHEMLVIASGNGIRKVA